jgi:hypothetical protein
MKFINPEIFIYTFSYAKYVSVKTQLYAIEFTCLKQRHVSTYMQLI